MALALVNFCLWEWSWSSNSLCAAQILNICFLKLGREHKLLPRSRPSFPRKRDNSLVRLEMCSERITPLPEVKEPCSGGMGEPWTFHFPSVGLIFAHVNTDTRIEGRITEDPFPFRIKLCGTSRGLFIPLVSASFLVLCAESAGLAWSCPFWILSASGFAPLSLWLRITALYRGQGWECVHGHSSGLSSGKFNTCYKFLHFLALNLY